MGIVLRKSKKQFGAILALSTLELIILAIYGISSTPMDLTSGYSNVFALIAVFGIFGLLFVGFGMLMAFTSGFGLATLVITVLIGVFTVQYYPILIQFFEILFSDHPFETEFITFDWSALMFALANGSATCLISIGSIVGRASLPQYVVVIILEPIFAAINQALCETKIGISDIGGGMLVHMFGSVFGLFMSIGIGVIDKKSPVREEGVQSDIAGKDNVEFEAEEKEPEVTKPSLIVCVIGSFVLFIFWPFFTAGPAALDLVSATESFPFIAFSVYLALIGSMAASFIFSALFRSAGCRFEIEDIANAGLAGGVIISSICNYIQKPFYPLIIGFLAGLVSVCGYVFILPVLAKKVGLKDVCGILNLHCMPSIIGTLLSLIYIGKYSKYDLFESNGITVRDQVASMFTTLGLSSIPGFLVGIICGLVERLPKSQYFDDSTVINLEEY
ncbi:hypothetical protein ADUPG1_012478 [Aduncisulcus paluster]|uniref:Ammonium transporter AmtB-like domain-containing protein n=1 Tax=Aduncisulcus paluster TaxID=2918883 RepID=A0ABQ5JZK8_9EUKA|nr:hypothetical protein ADUPG1_012478 [Aduncisulcus paluster]